MNLKEHQENWNNLATQNEPEWVVDTRRSHWNQKDFFDTGKVLIKDLFSFSDSSGVVFKKSRCLDFGCGVGRLSQALANHFDHVDGVDISEKMIESAKSKNIDNTKCNFFVVDNEKLENIEDNTYDVVFTYATLQHIEPFYVKKYLRNFLRVLKPGGILMFQEHAYAFDLKTRFKDNTKNILPRNLVNRIKKIKNGNKPIMEVFAISENKVRKIINENGAKVITLRDEPNASASHKTYFYIVEKEWN